MPLIAELLATPHELPDASRYTVANGVLYMISGVTFLTAPGAVQAIFADPAFAGHDEASVRVVGLLIVTIGWLVMFGGLSGRRRFVAATVVSRILLCRPFWCRWRWQACSRTHCTHSQPWTRRLRSALGFI